MRLSTSYSLIAASALAGVVFAQSDRDPLNNIDDLCSVNFSTDKVKAIVCTLKGESNVFTTSATSFLRSTDEHICCPVDNTCVRSDTDISQIGCYDPKKKTVSTASDSGSCEFKKGTCEWLGGTNGDEIVFEMKDVTKYTSVKDGKGVEASKSSSTTSSSSRSTSSTSSSPSESSKGAGSTLYVSYFGTLAVTLLSVGASVLL